LKKLAACPTPLYLRLAFEETRQWPSAATDGDLPELIDSVEGIVNDFLSRLEQPEHHNRNLVQRALGYLAASRNGLAEDELLEILSHIDPDVLPEFRKSSPKSPATDRLPFVIWSSLRADLSPYLSVRRADQTKLLRFYHRQIGEAIQTRVFGDGMKGRLHRRLVEFFGEQDNSFDSGALADHPNYRKASELVFHQIKILGFDDRSLPGIETRSQKLDQCAGDYGRWQTSDHRCRPGYIQLLGNTLRAADPGGRRQTHQDLGPRNIRVHRHSRGSRRDNPLCGNIARWGFCSDSG
jgi:hypothetical protein